MKNKLENISLSIIHSLLTVWSATTQAGVVSVRTPCNMCHSLPASLHTSGAAVHPTHSVRETAMFQECNSPTYKQVI